MRLICPNCDAQYEVPDDVIPPEGRDVQCSDCGNTWFQLPASAEKSRDDTLPERPPIPPEVSDILREEAELERQARARKTADAEPADARSDVDADVDPDSFEGLDPETVTKTIDDLNPSAKDAKPAHPKVDPANPFAVDPFPDEPEETEAERRARETRERMARMRGVAAGNPFEKASDSRKGVLPDVEEITSSLEPDKSAARAKKTIDLEDLNRRRRRGSGFRTGFTLVVFAGLFGLAIYMTHENLGRALPALAPMLDSFAAYVDQWRFWVDEEATRLFAQLQNYVSDILNG